LQPTGWNPELQGVGLGVVFEELELLCQLIHSVFQLAVTWLSLEHGIWLLLCLVLDLSLSRGLPLCRHQGDPR